MENAMKIPTFAVLIVIALSACTSANHPSLEEAIATQLPTAVSKAIAQTQTAAPTPTFTPTMTATMEPKAKCLQDLPTRFGQWKASYQNITKAFVKNDITNSAWRNNVITDIQTLKLADANLFISGENCAADFNDVEESFEPLQKDTDMFANVYTVYIANQGGLDKYQEVSNLQQTVETDMRRSQDEINKLVLPTPTPVTLTPTLTQKP
jgi:hypothetical protein